MLIALATTICYGSPAKKLTLLAASREEPLARRSQSSIQILSQWCSLTPPQAAGNRSEAELGAANALAGFNSVGTWEYSAPNVAEGYTTGEMLIVEKEDVYRVIIAQDEYNKVEAEDVEFDKKSLTFILYVESELVTVSGEFDKDEFTGTVSYSEGVFDITATRKQQGSDG